MSNIVLLNDGMYEYVLPPVPKDEKEILFHNLPKKEQYWHTPNIKNLKHLSEKEKITYIERERDRWLNGVWMFLNGEPVYLTGMHYDHMVYMTFKDGKAEYFDHQRNDFYFRDLTRKDPRCRGRCFIKPRRYGMTMEEITEATYTLMENFSNNVGLQSDTRDKVKSTLVTPIINSFARRPKFMRPDYYKPNGKLLQTQIVSKSTLAPEDDGEYQGDFILGWLRSFPALPRAMDGEEMAYIVDDEVWKWQESSPKETIDSNKMVIKGRNRSGKISVLSTMGDSDDYIKAVLDGFDIIAKSNPKIRNANGETISGLYEYFVSAIYSFEIPPDIFEVDKFGRVNKDKHLEYINNKLRVLDKNSKEYVFEKRKLPLKKEDALLSAQTATNFRRLVINARLNQLREMLPSEKPYIRGELVDDSYGRVHFISDEERQAEAGDDVIIKPGIWLWAYLPHFSIDKGIDARNRFRRSREGIYFPPVNREGGIGYDPIDFPKNQTSSNSLSRACIFVRKKFDYLFKEGDPNRLVDVPMGIALWRPDDPHDANKEAMKACRFTGFKCMHERSVSHVEEDFRESGMLPFLSEDKNGIYGMSPSDIKAKKDGVVMLQARYRAPKSEEERDQLMDYPFEEGLLSLDNFDIGNTTPFDPTMSEIYCEHELKDVLFTNQTEQSQNNLINYLHEITPQLR